MPHASHQYTPIGKNQIRLMTLRGYRFDNDPIQCTLEVHTYEEAPEYEALSYTNGDIEPSQSITLHGARFKVTTNLFDALKCLRRSRTDRVLWVDALCINQSDVDEKSMHAMWISAAFAKATRAVLWVEPQTIATEELVDCILRLEDRKSTNPFEIVKRLTAVDGQPAELRDPMSTAFFGKAWVIPEAYNSPAAVVQCGSSAVSWVTFVSAFKLVKPGSPTQRLLVRMSELEASGQAASSHALYNLLQWSRHAQAADPQDKIFGGSSVVDHKPSRSALAYDQPLSTKAYMRNLLAALCFCEQSCVPQLPYETFEEFLAHLDPIEDKILETIFENSQDIDIKSLLENDPTYIRINRSLFQAAHRNPTKGEDMVQLLQACIASSRSLSTTPSKAISSKSSARITPKMETLYPTEDDGHITLQEGCNDTLPTNEDERFLLPSQRLFGPIQTLMSSTIELDRDISGVPPEMDSRDSPPSQSRAPPELEAALLSPDSGSRDVDSLDRPPMGPVRSSIWSRTYDFLSRWLIRIENPRKGLSRVQYTCGCGEPMFLDVREVKPRGLEKLQQQLAGSAKQALIWHPGGDEAAYGDLPYIPPPTYAPGDLRANLRGGIQPPRGNGADGQRGDIETDPRRQQAVQAALASTTRRYLLLCVNTRKFTRLIHVDIAYVRNDQIMFDNIRRIYWEARKNDSWNYGLLIPLWVKARIPTAWQEWLSALHLRVPQRADLIEFRLVPLHSDLYPDKVKLGLPPVDQVKVAKNYHYDPCPAEVEVLSIPQFSHLLKPGRHSYNFWLKMFPKKLGAELDYQPASIGWGLIIHETWDWVVVLSSMLMLNILIGVAVILYAVLAHDASSALGMGGYAVSIITLLLTVKYMAWQGREDG